MPIFETVDTLTSSGNWTCPAGVFLVWVEGWGGGGGGGGGTAAERGGGGGGGGGYAGRWIRVNPGSLYAYIVGSLGTGGYGVDGVAGGDTYFINSSSGCKAAGGGEGLGAGAGSGGPGGAPVYYDIGYTGGAGFFADPGGGGGGGSAGTGSDGNDAASGTGANAVTGGGNGGNGSPTGTGSAPTGTPGGGGGGGGFPASGTRSGGNGEVGKLTVSYSKMRVFQSGVMCK